MGWEFSLMNWMQEHMRAPLLDQVMVVFTYLGEYGAIWILTGLGLTISKKYRRYGILMLCSLLITFLTGEVLLKNIICRVRPCNINTELSMLIARPTSYSFPSGHAASSFTSAYILLRMDKRIGCVGLVVAALIALSRVYLYVHFPTDVLVGMVLGLLMAALVYFLYQRLEKDGHLTRH